MREGMWLMYCGAFRFCSVWLVVLLATCAVLSFLCFPYCLHVPCICFEQ